MRALLFALIFCVGCSNYETAKEYLPSDAKNFRDVGNCWYTFEMEINGKNHKFLYYYRIGDHSKMISPLPEGR